MKGQFDMGAPIFAQIVDQMLSDIARGVLAPGAKVAPVRVLAAEYKVNPNTMQKSLEKLGDMGYLYTERTSGRFVTMDEEKIAVLRDSIPAKMTEDYVGEMINFGIPPDDVIKHVKNKLTERNEQNE